MFDFASKGGDAVLLMKAGGLPSITDADYNFRPSQPAQAEQVHHFLPPCMRSLQV